MAEKKLPVRKCVACGQMKAKGELFRLVKSDKGIALDVTYKASGRGAYVCRCKECVDLAVKKRGFNRSLRCQVSEQVIDSLYREI